MPDRSLEVGAAREQLATLAWGYMPARMLLSAAELGIFEYLGDREAKSRAVARDLDLDAASLEILLDGLAALGVLTKQADHYAIREPFRRFLLPDGEEYLGGTLGHLGNLWAAWSRLTDVVRKGRGEGARWTDRGAVDLAATMSEQARGLARRIAAIVDCSTAALALDVGSGPAAYAMAIAERYPHLRWTCLDSSDATLRLAAREIEGRGLRERIRLVRGDFLQDELGQGYDLAFLSSVVCLCSPSDSARLLEKCSRALQRAGRLVVHDLLLADDRTSPRPGAIFSVTMLLNTPGGRACSIGELKRWLRAAGFSRIHHVPLNPTTLVVATKGDGPSEAPP